MPQYTGPLRENYAEYFDVDDKWAKNIRARLDRSHSENYGGADFGELRDEYSFVPHQDAPDPVAYTQTRRAKKEGGFIYGDRRPIYRRVNREEPQAQETSEPVVEQESEPLPPRGSTFTEDTQAYNDTRLQRPENQAPTMGFTNDPMQDAIRDGEDINSHYINRFIPSLEADARLTAQEIGESGRFNLNRFIGKVPELGDPKDMFEYYSAQLRGEGDDDDD